MTDSKLLQIQPTAILLSCIHSTRKKRDTMCNTSMKRPQQQQSDQATDPFRLHTADCVTESKEGKTETSRFPSFLRLTPRVWRDSKKSLWRKAKIILTTIRRQSESCCVRTLKYSRFHSVKVKKVEALLSEEDLHHVGKSKRDSNRRWGAVQDHHAHLCRHFGDILIQPKGLVSQLNFK